MISSRQVQRRYGARLSAPALRRLGPLVAALAAFWSTAALPADSGIYTLDTGDEIQVSVFGEPNYPIEMSVDDAGMISIPLVGDVPVRGKTTAAVKQDVENLLRDKDLIINPFVQIAIKQYRPFFISGAIDHPGAYAFQPNMTVRHAVAIAGGFRALQTDTEPALTIADLRSDQDELGIEIFRQKLRLAAFQAELDGKTDFAVPPITGLRIDSSLVAEIMRTEQDQLAARLSDAAADLAHDQEALVRARGDVDTLHSAHGDREQVVGFQNQALVTARAMHDRGLTTQSSVLSAEKEHSLFREQVSQMEVQQAEAEQKVADLALTLGKKTEARRLQVLTEIQDAQVGLGKAETQMKHVTDKLLFMSIYGGTRSIDELGNSVRIVVHRRDGDTTGLIDANENTALHAGDLVEITVVRGADGTDLSAGN